MPTTTVPSSPGDPNARVPDYVVRKLVIATASMLILPIATFFMLRWLGAGALLSGGSAAGVANVVLIGYVIAAFLETDPSAEVLKQKKIQ